MVVGVTVNLTVLLLRFRSMQVFDLLSGAVTCQLLTVVKVAVVMVVVAGCCASWLCGGGI